jgi:hypothetical protein
MSSGSTGGAASPPATGPRARRRISGTRQQLPRLQAEIIRTSKGQRSGAAASLPSLADFRLRSLHVPTRPRTSADLMVGTQLRRLPPLARARGEHQPQPRDPIETGVDKRTLEIGVGGATGLQDRSRTAESGSKVNFISGRWPVSSGPYTRRRFKMGKGTDGRNQAGQLPRDVVVWTPDSPPSHDPAVRLRWLRCARSPGKRE